MTPIADDFDAIRKRLEELQRTALIVTIDLHWWNDIDGSIWIRAVTDIALGRMRTYYTPSTVDGNEFFFEIVDSIGVVPHLEGLTNIKLETNG